MIVPRHPLDPIPEGVVGESDPTREEGDHRPVDGYSTEIG